MENNEGKKKGLELSVNITYPKNEEYEYQTALVMIDMDKTCRDDIINGRGFYITENQNPKKDTKSDKSIYSSKFGQTLADMNPYMDRYKCKCGHLKSRYLEGSVCPICNTKVKFVDDDFEFTGWITIHNQYHIIHPNFYKIIESIIGEKTLKGILDITDEKDVDGFSKNVEVNKNDPYHGIGMIGFYEKFDEIIDFYAKKNPSKVDRVNELYRFDSITGESNRDKVFCHSIPVYTTHLRPYNIDNNIFAFEGTNALYNIMARVAMIINNDNLRINRKRKPKSQLLYDLQKYNNRLSDEIDAILSHKKGIVRTLFGGRFNFTSRSVIVSGPYLRCDQIRLPYKALIELLQQVIINILQKTYDIMYHEAYKMWFRASIKPDPTVKKIIESIIASYPEGIPFIINRNPTINYGGIMQVYCIGINDNYTMNISLQILPFLAADFDGDALNIMFLINKNLIEACEKVFNPRNTMYISKNDGRFDNRLNHGKDTIVNLNTLIRLGRDSYSNDELEQIKALQMS